MQNGRRLENGCSQVILQIPRNQYDMLSCRPSCEVDDLSLHLSIDIVNIGSDTHNRPTVGIAVLRSCSLPTIGMYLGSRKVLIQMI